MVLMELSIFPLGKGDSVSAYVARCIEVIDASGLDYELNAMGTVVEGELDDVLGVLKGCFDVLATDCDRVSCSAKFDYRAGAGGRISAKVASIERALNRPAKRTT